MKASVLAALVLLSPLGNAAVFSTASGNYGNSDHFHPAYGEKPGFHVEMKDSHLVVTDLTNNLTYEINTASGAEQLIQPKLLEHLRTLSGARTIAKLINRITISGLWTDDQGVLHATFNLYLSTISAFGWVHAKLSVGAEVANHPCVIERDDGYDQTTNQPLKKSYTGSCLKADLGTSFGLESLSASLPSGKEFSPELTNAIGMAADLMFKFYSPVMTGLVSLYEQR